MMNKVKVIIMQCGYRLFLENIDVLYCDNSEDYPTKFQVAVWISRQHWIVCDNIPTKEKAEEIVGEIESFMMSDNETKLDFRHMYPVETGDDW